MKQQNWNQQDMNLQEPNQQQGMEDRVETLTLAPKTILSRAGFALSAMAVVVLLVQLVVEYLVSHFNPGLADRDWYVWALTAFTVVGMGLPTIYLVSKKIPDSIIGAPIKLKPIQFIVIFFICTAAMYITNFFSVIITVGIALIKGEDIFNVNPLMEVIQGSSFIYTLIYASFVAPIVEEIIFRKILLNKLRRFGDVPAILLTGLAFGFFHMNLSQFFYASALGMIFAYVTIRTNTIKYSIMLHIMINLIGTSLIPFVTQKSILFSLILVVWVLGAVTTGTVLFILNVRKIKLNKAVVPLIEKKSHYVINLGTILYIAICLAMIVVTIVS